jgi:uncharacterized membrane protein YjjP (DUF1212 family)
MSSRRDDYERKKSEGSADGQQDPEKLPDSIYLQTGTKPEDRPREPRVKFRSLNTAQRDAETREPRPEPQADHLRQPFRRPSRTRDQGDLYLSQDITETPLRDRLPTGEDGRGGTGSVRKILAHGLPHGTTRRIATRLRHPRRTSAPHVAKEWHSDAEDGVPLSDFTGHRDGQPQRGQVAATSEAHRLVREMTQQEKQRKARPTQQTGSGRSTPTESDTDFESRDRSNGGAGGILSNLLKLYGQQPGSNTACIGNQQRRGDASEQDMDGIRTPGWSSPRGGSSGTATPKREKVKWYKKPQSQSSASLMGATSNLGTTGTPTLSNEMLSAAAKRRSKSGKPRLEDEIRVTVHIAEIITRQRYLMQLCRALMRFGAPTHRLEEYMQMTARVLEVDCQFLYFPGCMIMSFDDHSTRTTEVKMVRMAQGVDLGRLADTHDVYKNVVHDLIGVEEATQHLEEIMNRKPKFNVWIIVIVYGLASASIGPFAFDARPIDMPICFFLGCLLGIMQHAISPQSSLYSNVFEVTASIATSFLARAFGSIRWGMVNGNQQYLFCFSALAQSAIALILPGFLVLCSSLELQSHQIIAGSIRMVYAIIYSLFLGYGITVGTTIYGLMDGAASSNTRCPPSPIENPYLQRFPFVLLSALWLAIAHQGKWKQAPVMMFIAIAGYIVNFFSTKRLGSNTQVANTLAAFTIGILGNLYSRICHGHAATAILPAIFILVPSGLAATGSLISGVEYADQIRGNVTGDAKNSSASGHSVSQLTGSTDDAVFNLGYGMVEVAIGITAGLFMAALVIYPYGKRRSGLFSF